MHLPLQSLALVLAAATASAQACATLTVTGSGLPGTDLVFAHHGNADTYPIAVIGDELGSTVVRYGPLGTLRLGIDFPFLPLLLPETDANGDSSRTIHVPAQVPAFALFAQSFDYHFTWMPLSLNICTSDVVPFQIGQ